MAERRVRAVVAAAGTALLLFATVACGGEISGQAIAPPASTAPTGTAGNPALAVIPVRTVPGADRYPVSFDQAGATVLAGQPTAKVTVDLYEDPLCGICGTFEAKYFAALEKQLELGNVQVRYHLLDLLDNSSVPPGYPLMAANTALAVAAVAPGKFMSYLHSLFGKQPAENGPAWTQAELTNLANRLGVRGTAFNSLVDGRAYDAQIRANLQAAEQDQALWQPNVGGFGTPTVVANNAMIDWNANPGWLDTLVKAAYPS